MREKLSDRFAASAPAGLYWDSDPRAPKGFGLRVTAALSRAWVLNFRRQSDGVERRITLGSTTAWPIAEARKRAAALRREIDAGADPLGDRQAQRAAPTVQDLVERYIAERLPGKAPRTAAEERSLLAQHILPAIGKLKVEGVRRQDIEKLHREVTARGKLVRANRVVAEASVLFSAAIAWDFRSDNPCRGVDRNREEPRQRYLSIDEIGRLICELDAHRDRRGDAVDAIEFLLLTGCRVGELLAACWGDFHLSERLWIKPSHTVKQRREHRLVLNDEAVALLRRRLPMPGRVTPLRQAEQLIFPLGYGNPKAREAQLTRAWYAIREAAGLGGVRLHDLRHSHASILASSGRSLIEIGALLGHRRVATTARYSHLFDESLRSASAIVGQAVRGKVTK